MAQRRTCDPAGFQTPHPPQHRDEATGATHPPRAVAVDNATTPAGASPDRQPAPAEAGHDARPEEAPRDRAVTGKPAAPAGHARWWLAVLFGVVVALPCAWLLAYAAALPFFLGVFFFALFGLVIGAATHRIAAPRRPYTVPAIITGTALIVVVTWLLTVLKEAHDFPADMVGQAERTRDIGDRTIHEFRAEVAAEVRAFLREEYPPGGTLGYVRWVITDGRIERGELQVASRTLQVAQAGPAWILRVILSISMLAFGVGSQTLSLRWQREPSVRAIDDRAPA